MTLGTLRQWLDALEASGVKSDEEVFVDATSGEEGVTFRGRITGGTLEHAHDEDDTPFGVLFVDDINDGDPDA